MSVDNRSRKYRPPSNNALFLLVPANPQATQVLSDKHNYHLVSWACVAKKPSLEVGFHIRSHSSPNTLATLGRDDCDITIRVPEIARLQCSFEIDDLDTGLVMFYDRSHNQTSQIAGDNTAPFQQSRSPRKVLVYPQRSVSTRVPVTISMGSSTNQAEAVLFNLEWLLDENQIKDLAQKHGKMGENAIVNPRKARTYNSMETMVPSTTMTPDEAFRKPHDLELRFLKRELRGCGTFGSVWRAIDFDTGRLMAMKQVSWIPGKQSEHRMKRIRMEVELMRRAKHPNAVELITSQNWNDESCSIHIFMGLEEGNLSDLWSKGGFAVRSGQPKRCLQQMLSVLDFLSYKGIVHRDVKPENILYSRSSNGPGQHYRLSDFGVGNLSKYAHTFAGSLSYMAPEILKYRNRPFPPAEVLEQQSPKLDVWSLFVTIACATNIDGYQNKTLETCDEILTAARAACKGSWMSKYSSMVAEDPNDRASAHDILIKFFDGVGAIEIDNNIIEKSDDSDEIFLNSRPSPRMRLPQIPILQRRSARAHRISKHKKRTWPAYTRNRLYEISLGL